MTLNCNGKLIDLSAPKVMGILNVTPDSFYDGGQFTNNTSILQHAGKMLEEGADFIDIGGYSSRPNAEDISEDDELQRVVPVIESVLKEFPQALISIDTFRSKVAEESINTGAVIVNDISAGSLDAHMMETVARLQVPYIMMHMKGTPQTMQSQAHYKDVVKEILFYFSEKTAQARSLGINDLIIDPGFGFAKTVQQNFEILQKLELFRITDLPLLIGLSRKSMVYKTLGTTSDNALNGTTSLNTIALMKGANILRVHDVKEAVEAVRLSQLIIDN